MIKEMNTDELLNLVKWLGRESHLVGSGPVCDWRRH